MACHCPGINPEYNYPSYFSPPHLLFRAFNWTKFHPSSCCGHLKDGGPLITAWGLGAASHKVQYLLVYSCSFSWLQIALNKFLGCRRSCVGFFSLAWTLSRKRGREEREREDSVARVFSVPHPLLCRPAPLHTKPLATQETGHSRCLNLLLRPWILLA